MPEFDLHHNCKVALAITPAIDQAAITDGLDINTLGYESVEFIIWSGTTAAGTISFTLQHADDDGSGSADTYADVTAATDQLGALPVVVASTDDDEVYRVGYIGKKQWVRLQSVETAGWTTANFGAVALLSNPVVGPVAEQDNT